LDPRQELPVRLFSMRSAVGGVAGLLSVTAMVLALIHPGVVTQEVDLNDGGVWVTNENLHIIAHLNYPAQTLDGYIRAGSAQFDVDQSAGTVFVSDTPSDTYTRIDVAQYSMLTPLSAASTMELGGDRVGVVDPEAGSVWAMAAEDYGAFSAQTTKPVLRDEKGAVLAMGTDGSVHVASAATGRMTTVTRAGSMDDAATTELPELGDAPDLQVSAVGDKTEVKAIAHNGTNPTTAENSVTSDVDNTAPQPPQPSFTQPTLAKGEGTEQGGVTITPPDEATYLRVDYEGNGQTRSLTLTRADASSPWQVQDGTQKPAGVDFDATSGVVKVAPAAVDDNTTLSAIAGKGTAYSDRVSVTTAPASTTAPLPIRTPPRIVALPPIRTSFPMIICLPE